VSRFFQLNAVVVNRNVATNLSPSILIHPSCSDSSVNHGIRYNGFWPLGVVFLMCIFANGVCLACIILCVIVVSHVFVALVYLLYLMCICWPLSLDAGLLARSQYAEGSATGHLDTGFSWFRCVYKRML
jgi:hypothetical protein